MCQQFCNGPYTLRLTGRGWVCKECGRHCSMLADRSWQHDDVVISQEDAVRELYETNKGECSE